MTQKKPEYQTDYPVVDLKSHLMQERKLFMGKLSNDDKIPGSNMTVKEAKEKEAQIQAEYENTRNERRQRVLEGNQKRLLATPRGLENSTLTTVVVPGVNVELKLPSSGLLDQTTTTPTETAAKDLNKLPELPPEAELKAMRMEDLHKLAEARKIPAIPNEKKEDLILRLLA